MIPIPAGTAVTVLLSGGKVALIDLEDAPAVLALEWSAIWSGWHWYARARYDGETVYLHRFILGITDSRQVDHENQDGLDCRRLNLRVATQSQNNANRRKQATAASSKLKGVDAHVGKWRARVKKNGNQITIGHFEIEEDAARAYDAKARELHGEFALCNFPEELVPDAGLEPATSAV